MMVHSARKYKVQIVHPKGSLSTRDPSASKTLSDVIKDECPSLSSSFRPSPLVPGPHSQTIYAFLGYYVYYAHSILFPRFTREVYNLSDGGTVALDWALVSNYAERPIVVVLSGVTGTSCDFYVRKCYDVFFKMQYSVLVIQSRGCGGLPFTTPLPFHCGMTIDCREIISAVSKRYPKSMLLGLGFSLGANILAKYLGEEGESCPLVASVIVGNPYDMFRVIQHVDQKALRPTTIYGIAILNFLKTAFNANKKMILSAPIKFNTEKITRAKTIMEFTEEMTRKAFGYGSARELLEDSSSGPYLDRIRTPVLFLNSLDDPISREQFIPYDSFLTNPYLVLALTEYGGHIGYMGDLWPTSWVEHPVSEFLQAMVKHYG